MSSAICFNLDQSKILSCGNGSNLVKPWMKAWSPITHPLFQSSFIDDLSIPNDKILDLSDLKAFADKKINVTEKLKFVLGRVEDIVGKGENAVSIV